MQDGNQQNEPGWVFKPGDTAQPAEIPEPVAAPVDQAADKPAPAQSSPGVVDWTASEYIANQKSAGWYFLLAVASIALAAVVYLLTKDMVSTAVIPIIGLVLGIFAARQPRTLNYRIDNRGVYIGQKFYSYDMFKYFSIGNDHAMGYISLAPLKRFMPPLAIHYAPEDEDMIANTLADFLPYEEHKPDPIDSITRRLRF